MFRFNRIFFILSNFIIAFLGFIFIFNLRYSWIDFPDIEKRIITLNVLILFFLYSLTIVIFNISFKVYEVNKITILTESLLLNIFVSIITVGVFGIYFFFTQRNFARFVFFAGFGFIPFLLTFFNKIIFIFMIKRKTAYDLLYFGSEANFQLFKELVNDYNKWFPMKLSKVLMDNDPEMLKKKLKKCDMLVVDTDQKFRNDFINILNEYEIEGGKIYSLVDLFSYFDQSLPAEVITNTHYEMFSTYKIESFYFKYIKRIGDIFISIILLLLLSPLTLLIMFLIKITSRGKIIFKQIRTTVKGKEFYMYKFRSMTTTAEKDGVQLTKHGDQRITLIGKIIRPLRIDEIPQLLNVLRGEMSFIGPRPERPEIIERIIQKYPLFKKRLLIKPGLTGWAQVKYTYVNKIENMNKKLSYDLFYLNHLSVLLDLKILLYTLETVIFRRGAL